MPGGTITTQQDHILWVLLRKLFEKHIHAYRVAIRQDQKTGFSGQRLYRAIGIPVFSDMMAGNAGTDPFLAPAVFRLVDPAKASLILKHQPNLFFIVENFFQFCHCGVNFFEVSMTSSLAFRGCLLRGMTFLHPCRCRTL